MGYEMHISFVYSILYTVPGTLLHGTLLSGTLLHGILLHGTLLHGTFFPYPGSNLPKMGQVLTLTGTGLDPNLFKCFQPTQIGTGLNHNRDGS